MTVHVPQALHEDLVLVRDARPGREAVGGAGAPLQAEALVEVEQEVVEDGQLVVAGHLALADLSM